jgi:hypothetical protein
MFTETNHNMEVEEALKILQEYSCIQIKRPESEEEKQTLRQALLLIASLSEYENLGICADNSRQGYSSLNNYLAALGYDVKLDPNSLPESDRSVYIKFNTQKMTHFLDSYSGTYRGVLISCQGEDETILGTYGHFPLDLFDFS